MIRLTRRTFLAGTTAMTAAGLVPFRAAAQTPRTYHALLIACTDYPTLPPKYSLIGPNNDAMLVRQFLLESAPVKFAPENVTLLADNIPEAAGVPTYENIKAALANIAAKVQRDDFVYLHLSGHGSQQPQAQDGNETDGFDEFFLPRDIGKWAARDKPVPNALIDDDIGAALDAIRDKGAFVWAIFDCCHSGTATRAVDTDESDRKVEFADLVEDTEEAKTAAAKAQAEAEAAATATSRGMDESSPRKPAFALAPTSAEGTVKGKLVAFYAAQSVETTPEMPLPKGSEDAARYGLFTYTVFSKLASNPRITYRQLGQAVLQQYSGDGRTRPTPLFEGELDARVFGTEGTAVQQWTVDVKGSVATISAGLLHRITEGTRLAVLPSALAEDLSGTIGYLEVTKAKNLVSTVVPVEFDGKPAPKLAELTPDSVVRVAAPAVSYQLAVARPSAPQGLETETALVNSVLDELVAAEDKRFNVKLVDAGADAELRLAVMRENAIEGAAADATDQPAVWFLPASGDVTLKDGSRPPLIIIHPDDRPKLAKAVNDNLTTIFRATSLSRLAAASDYDPAKVSVEFQLVRTGSGATEPLVPATVPRAVPGDEVHIVAKNNSKELVDINILYVGSDYSITHIAAERLTDESELKEGLFAFTDTSFGMERMIAVLTDAPPQSEKEDLSFLAQGGVPAMQRAVGQDRGEGQSGFAEMLLDIGLAPATRSVTKLNTKGGTKGAVMIFPVETIRPAV